MKKTRNYVTDECVAQSLPLNKWISSFEFCTITGIIPGTAKRRLTQLVGRGFLEKKGFGKNAQWRMTRTMKEKALKKAREKADMYSDLMIEVRKRGRPAAPIPKTPAEIAQDKAWSHLRELKFI